MAVGYVPTVNIAGQKQLGVSCSFHCVFIDASFGINLDAVPP